MKVRQVKSKHYGRGKATIRCGVMVFGLICGS